MLGESEAMLRVENHRRGDAGGSSMMYDDYFNFFWR